jgi:hypothetical protein
LKQERQRASRRFLKEGARSSLRQYRQTNFSLLAAVRVRCDRCWAALLVMEEDATLLLMGVFFLIDAPSSLATPGQGD